MVFHFCTQKRLPYGQYTHSGIRVRPKTKGNDQFPKNTFLNNDSPGLKADSRQKSKSLKSTFHKCVANVIPVTTQTPMRKSGNFKVKYKNYAVI